MPFLRKKPRPRVHPDPVTELKLRNIAAIDSLRAQAMRQTVLYRNEIAKAQDQARSAAERHGVRQAERLEPIIGSRIKRAEDGIRQQQELIIGLNEKLEKAIADSGLSDSDLAYLNLEDQ